VMATAKNDERERGIEDIITTAVINISYLS
jgi:hypothetical protein